MMDVSNGITDAEVIQPTAHEIEAAGQVLFDFGTPIDVEPLPEHEPPMLGDFTFAGDALEGPVREPFGAWLLKQKDRKGWVGDLAKAALRDPAFPKRGDPDDVRKRLRDLHADGDTFEALDDAELDWASY